MTRSMLPSAHTSYDQQRVTTVVEAESLLVYRDADDGLILINGAHLLEEIIRDQFGAASDQPLLLGRTKITIEVERSDSY